MNLPARWRFKIDRFRRSLRSSLSSEPSAGRPRLCPNCRTLVGATATRCHVCGASLTFSLAAASRSLSAFLPSTSPATYFVLGLSIVLFLVSMLASARVTGQVSLLGEIAPQVLQRLGASLPLPYDIDQPWRLITAVFLHGGLLHIGMNCWVLMDIGPIVEEAYGSARYLFVYVVTGAAGFALSSFRFHFSIGASGALMGLIGVMLAITTHRGGGYMQAVRSQLIRWVIYIFLFGFLVPGIDNLAHFGGLAAGFLLGRIFGDAEPQSPEARRRAYAFGWLAGIAIVASFLLMLQQYFRPLT